MKVLLILLSTLAILKEAYLRVNDKVNIEVFFESLCPDSVRFISEQLHPHWKELSSHVNLNFVPFGKSLSLDGGATFTCQHGPQECKGNRILSCALNVIPDQDIQVEYVSCFMKIFKLARNNPEEFGEQCAKNIGLDLNEVLRCYHNDEGTTAQLKAQETTVKLRPKFIPTIVYNGVFDQELQNESLLDFKAVVCKFITKDLPEICHRSSFYF